VTEACQASSLSLSLAPHSRRRLSLILSCISCVRLQRCCHYRSKQRQWA
jgi:hypothetical protein